MRWARYGIFMACWFWDGCCPVSLAPTFLDDRSGNLMLTKVLVVRMKRPATVGFMGGVEAASLGCSLLQQETVGPEAYIYP